MISLISLINPINLINQIGTSTWYGKDNLYVRLQKNFLDIFSIIIDGKSMTTSTNFEISPFSKITIGKKTDIIGYSYNGIVISQDRKDSFFENLSESAKSEIELLMIPLFNNEAKSGVAIDVIHEFAPIVGTMKKYKHREHYNLPCLDDSMGSEYNNDPMVELNLKEFCYAKGGATYVFLKKVKLKNSSLSKFNSELEKHIYDKLNEYAYKNDFTYNEMHDYAKFYHKNVGNVKYSNIQTYFFSLYVKSPKFLSYLEKLMEKYEATTV